MPPDDKQAPPPTRAVMYGQDLPTPDADLYGKTDPIPTSMTVVVHMEAGPRAPSKFVMRSPVLVLGRGEGIADVDVGDDSASRRHAFIAHRGGKFTLNDMGSTNGTILNGQLVGKAALKSGDQIQVGTAVMRFEIKK